jgi:hypothetical protein
MEGTPPVDQAGGFDQRRICELPVVLLSISLAARLRPGARANLIISTQTTSHINWESTLSHVAMH